MGRNALGEIRGDEETLDVGDGWAMVDGAWEEGEGVEGGLEDGVVLDAVRGEGMMESGI